MRLSITVMLLTGWLTALLTGQYACAQDATEKKDVAEKQEVAEKIAPLSIPATNDGMPGDGPVRRADWFQGVWNQRRNQFAKTAEQDQNAVVFFGDSITQGWGGRLEKLFPGMKVANRGISGDTTRGMLYRLPTDVLPLNPKAYVLLMGTNDLEENAPAETIVGNVRLILEGIHAHNAKAPVILCLVMPSSETKKRPAARIREINAGLLKLVKNNPQVIVVDTYKQFANKDGDARAEEFPDLLHPNDAGYVMWANALRPVFETLELLPVEADDFQIEEGFTPLFNGKDLTGWGYRVTSQEMRDTAHKYLSKTPDLFVWPFVEEDIFFEGQSQTPDGRFVARNGRLVITTPAEGRKIQILWTQQEFASDFTLRLEFRATPNADSGVFLRVPQLQCRDYLVAGPYKNLTQYKAQDWNQLEVVVKDGVARCTCNGEVLEEALKLPATGPIGLEGDQGQMEYRRLRIRTSD